MTVTLEMKANIKIRPTNNPVPLDHRTQAIGILNKLILNMSNVALSLRHSQWNMPCAPQYADLFDPAIKALEEHATALAERVHAMGGFIPGTADSIATQSEVEAFPVQDFAEEDYKHAILTQFAQLADLTRFSLMKADNINEPVTSFYLAETAVSMEKHLSMFERQFGGFVPKATA